MSLTLEEQTEMEDVASRVIDYVRLPRSCMYEIQYARTQTGNS